MPDGQQDIVSHVLVLDIVPLLTGARRPTQSIVYVPLLVTTFRKMVYLSLGEFSGA